MQVDFPKFGKVGKIFFDNVIYPKLGAKRDEVLVGPNYGCDNAVVKINDRQVMILTSDPLSIIPALGLEDSAWLTVHLLASDLATSGIPPMYAVLDFNLPPQITKEEFEIYWDAFHRECEKLGIAIVGGHTGKFFGIDYTIVGGGTFIAIGDIDKYLSSNMAKPGDRIVITKGGAIATTGILARVFPETIERNFGSDFLKEAQSYFRKFSVVDDALTAVKIGVRNDGVSAMHDATEGGVFGGIYEMAIASGCGVHVYKEKVKISETTRKICDLFEIDPYISLSEGTLIIAVKEEKVSELVNVLAENGIESSEVGYFEEPSYGLWIENPDGSKEALVYPEADPYWNAYINAINKGWR
ncbi:MAG: AIR synthase family protein [Candidatus Kryptonium sp.]|nr:AIR synthase family protein [Candidatus Kryptonium sp.]MCX7762175.1 AIR synthase family protein [Candidatus Kryptonium sp.]MDW8108975.1 AIR synthase family protein [Candidatus Kryptonium sp.]